MITIHHLNFSRSTRIIWLMEELGEPYEIVPHTRDPNTFRSPQTLDRIHPLGKAPVIEDGALVIAESGAIIEYVIATYGRGKLIPAQSGPAIAAEIPDNGYLTDAFSGADIQMSYVLEVARMGKLLAAYPSLEKYMARLEQRPAYKRSIERGGPVRLPLG